MYRSYQGYQQKKEEHYYPQPQSKWGNTRVGNVQSTQMMMGHQSEGYQTWGIPITQKRMIAKEKSRGMKEQQIGGNYQGYGSSNTMSTFESDYNHPINVNRPNSITMAQNNQFFNANPYYYRNNTQFPLVSNMNYHYHHPSRLITQSNYSVYNNNKNIFPQSMNNHTQEQLLLYSNSPRYEYYQSQQHQQCYMNEQQYNDPIVHYDNDHYQHHIEQQKPQKSSIELLIIEIHQVNNDIQSFLQNVSTHSIHHHHQQEKLHQLLQEANLIEHMLDQNYKIYSIIYQQQENQQSFSSINSYTNKRFQQLFGLNNSTNKGNIFQQETTKNNYNHALIMDYQQQLQKLLKIQKYYLGSKIPDCQNHTQTATLQPSSTSQHNYTNTHSINLFTQLILSICDFYRFNYLLKQHIHDNSFYDTENKLGKQLNNSNVNGLPLLVKSVIWHLQALRVLVWVYQYEMKQVVLTNNNQSYNAYNTKYQSSDCLKSLTSTKSHSITISQSLQQLLAAFLQKITVQPQDDNLNYNSAKQPIHQTVWFFYYQYPQFNQQWICLLLDTILKSQMVMGVGCECLLDFIIVNKHVNQQNHLSIDKENNLKDYAKDKQIIIKKKPKKLTNQSLGNNKIKYKKDPKTNHNNYKTIASENDNKPNTSTSLPQQAISNILSITSLLLFPHQNYHSNSSQLPLTLTINNSHISSNPICRLLEQPVRKMILSQMKLFQFKLQQSNCEQMNENDRKSLIISKLVLIHKITNLVSFFTTKLNSSKSKTTNENFKNTDTNKHKRKNHNFDTKSTLNINNFTDLPMQLNDYQYDQTPINYTDSFSIELKIMQMTLFVRQMCDILMLDSLVPFSIQNIHEKGTFYYVNLWIDGLSIKSMIGMLFEKVLRRKQLSIQLINFID